MAESLEPEVPEERSSFSPGKLVRIAAMVNQMLEEAHTESLDAEALVRLREVYQSAVEELDAALPLELVAELDRLTAPFDSGELGASELRLAQSQLVGWLSGLMQGLQISLLAQHMGESKRPLLPGSDPGDDTGQYL